jgi:3-methylcrotonyl-CoA carboxylase alpha subunit
VVTSPSFAQAKLDTALIQREEKTLFHQEKLSLPGTIAAYIASVLIAERQQQTANPFSQRDGWRPFGITTRRFAFEWHDKPAHAVLSYLHDGALSLAVKADNVDAQGVLSVQSVQSQGDDVQVQFADQRFAASVHLSSHEKGLIAGIFTAQGATKIVVIDPYLQISEDAAHGGRLTAPMPGKLVSFAVKAGDAVKAGQTLAVMEAMKMEHTIAAPRDGVVAEVLFAPGDQVTDGAELLKLEA